MDLVIRIYEFDDVFFKFYNDHEKNDNPFKPLSIEIKGNSIEVRGYKFCLQTFSKGFNIILTKTFFFLLTPFSLPNS